MPLPPGIVLAFYGDDFTGSTDAMEVTARAGLRTVLFTRPPDEGLRARFAEYHVVGLAGTARARGPDWMDENLPDLFAPLAALGAPILQYKVCSTFDSSPRTGSIGRAIEIGRAVTGARFLPVVVGAPNLGRWLAFGNLFARAGGAVHRIDRHPTMSRHPVTPMTESDLARHLGGQTDLEIGKLTLDGLGTPAGEAAVAEAVERGSVLLIDTVDAASQAEAGRVVWDNRAAGVFAAASSGLQYALVAHWRAAGLIGEAAPDWPPLAPVENLLVLSGSCSPVTAEQIDAAEAAGFATVRLDAVAAAEDRGAAEAERLLAELLPRLAAGAPALVYAARSVDDPAVQGLADHCAAHGIAVEAAQERIGRTLGRIARGAVRDGGLRRLVIAGGDTSGHVVESTPVDALEMRAPLAPGVPVCRCHSEDADFDGLEMVLKGGQLGHRTFFADARGG